MEPWQGQLLRKQYGRKDWPTLGGVPVTLTSVLVHSMEPLLGQSPSWPPRWLTLLIRQTWKPELREVQSLDCGRGVHSCRPSEATALCLLGSCRTVFS